MVLLSDGHTANEYLNVPTTEHLYGVGWLELCTYPTFCFLFLASSSELSSPACSSWSRFQYASKFPELLSSDLRAEPKAVKFPSRIFLSSSGSLAISALTRANSSVLKIDRNENWRSYFNIGLSEQNCFARSLHFVRGRKNGEYKKFCPYPSRVVGWLVLYVVCVSVCLCFCVKENYE